MYIIIKETFQEMDKALVICKDKETLDKMLELYSEQHKHDYDTTFVYLEIDSSNLPEIFKCKKCGKLQDAEFKDGKIKPYYKKCAGNLNCEESSENFELIIDPDKLILGEKSNDKEKEGLN
jgi:hypothetical protein